jgi:diadenylate cyclase
VGDNRLLGRLAQLYEALGTRDVVQIVILAVVLFVFLRFLGKTCGTGSSLSRGLGLVIMGVFLLLQVVIACLDLPELATVLDYLLTTVLVALLVIFQPELRRGLMMLGRAKVWRTLWPTQHALADLLAEAAVALSRDCIGALIAIQRDTNLASYAETGERIDGKCSSALVRTLFTPHSPLHDGAVIIQKGQIVAAGCQLPLRHPELTHDPLHHSLGMRHRAALSLSDETDAVVLVVSEETGRISLAHAGHFEPVPRENLARRLADLLNATPALKRAA